MELKSSGRLVACRGPRVADRKFDRGVENMREKTSGNLQMRASNPQRGRHGGESIGKRMSADETFQSSAPLASR